MHPRSTFTMERYQEVVIALSESVIKNLLKRSLAEKSRLRHIRLAIKPRYLGNHASQIQCYYRPLSGSYGRSFRIRHKKIAYIHVHRPVHTHKHTHTHTHTHIYVYI